MIDDLEKLSWAPVWESTAEFAAKILWNVVKVYPAAPEELQEKLAIEHLLKGLPDAQTGYDVMVKQPRD